MQFEFSFSKGFIPQENGNSSLGVFALHCGAWSYKLLEWYKSILMVWTTIKLDACSRFALTTWSTITRVDASSGQNYSAILSKTPACWQGSPGPFWHFANDIFVVISFFLWARSEKRERQRKREKASDPSLLEQKFDREKQFFAFSSRVDFLIAQAENRNVIRVTNCELGQTRAKGENNKGMSAVQLTTKSRAEGKKKILILMILNEH